MIASNTMRVLLNISADQYKRYYQGGVSAVLARSHDGRTIQFPANILKPFVTHEGISGEFEIYFDSDNRFQKIEKL